MVNPSEKLTLLRDDPREIRHFGNYEVLSRIGTGGMAEIFKCRLSGIGGFDKVVVVKRMLPDLLHDPELVRMFLDEARIAAGLSHPNIVQIYEINQLDGNPYIVMEYARGPTLSRVIHESWKQGKSCAKVAVKVMSEVAAALAHVHEACDASGQPLEIVHRDVTPHNVVVTTEGVAKLLDFGVAKAAGRLSKTNTGNIKGKFRYMAPEQLHSGDTVDGRADVFAVGACLYLAATGVHAYSSRSDVEVLKAAAAGAYLPPSKYNPAIDPELERLILWAMAPRLAVRCPSALALHELLDGYVSQGPERITNHQVSRFLRQLFGDFSNSGSFGSAYNDEVRSGDFAMPSGSVGGARSLSASSSPLPRPDPVEVELADLESAAKAPAASATAAQAPSQPAAEEGPSRSKGLLFAAAAALALVVLGGVLLMRSRDAKHAPLAPPKPAPVVEVVAPAAPAPPAPKAAEPAEPAPQVVPTPAVVAVAPEPAKVTPDEAPAAKAPKGGKLSIVTDVPARILIDGEAQGNSPLRAFSLTAERHQVEVQARGFPSQKQAVAIVPEREVQLAFHFARRRPEPPAMRVAPAAEVPRELAPTPAPAPSAAAEPAPKPAEREAPEPVAVARVEEPVRPEPARPEPAREPPAPREAVEAPTPPPIPLLSTPEPARVKEARPAPEAKPHAEVRLGSSDGTIASCPEGASLAGAAPPAGSAIWCQLPSGVKQGKYVRWHANGVRAETGDYLNGKKNGRWLEFYEDGSEREKTEWRRGVKTW